MIAARKQPVAPVDGADPGLTVHGVAGAPPEEADMKKFKMIVPMRPDERLEAGEGRPGHDEGAQGLRGGLQTMRFGAPGFLPLLAVPAALLLLWGWQLWQRRADARAFLRRRQVPVDERIPFFGELLFWFFLILAAASAFLALAKPQAVTSLVRTAGVDSSFCRTAPRRCTSVT